MFRIGQRVKVIKKCKYYGQETTIREGPKLCVRINSTNFIGYDVNLWHPIENRWCGYKPEHLVPLDKPQLSSMEEIKKLELGIEEVVEV